MRRDTSAEATREDLRRGECSHLQSRSCLVLGSLDESVQPAFDVPSFTAYLVNVGKLRADMTERIHPHLLQRLHLVNAHVRLCLAKHIRYKYTQLNCFALWVPW